MREGPLRGRRFRVWAGVGMEVNLIVKNVVTWDITITQGLMFGLSLNGVDSSIISRGRVLYNITVL